jgi:ABC-type antimicrobial peptide transport system permease subunit
VSSPASDLEIVGIVKDALNASLRAAPQPMVYVPWFQHPSGSATLLVRPSGSLAESAAAIHKALQPSFPTTPLEVHGLDEQVERTLVKERLMASLAGGFGVLGLLLAGVGLYGLLAYSVLRRTKEIGVRMALGAQPRGVVWLVAKRALGLVGLGVAFGVPAAWMLSQSIQSMLFGLTSTDRGVVTVAVILLVAASLAAASIPARRAARVDPMIALRHE